MKPIPIVGDFLGDGRDDFATVYQPERTWWVKDWDDNIRMSHTWGLPGQQALVCDWDKNGVADRIMVGLNSNSTYEWYVLTDSGQTETKIGGSIDDMPNCDRNYTGKGTSASIYRPSTGEWFFEDPETGAIDRISWGIPGDIPL